MLKSIAIPVAAIVGELLSAMPAQAENSLKPDLLNGEQLARRVCLGCHGETVLHHVRHYPNLKGQKSAYITKQLRAFKSGERKDAYMQATAGQLSEQDIIDVAAYYGSLQPDNLKSKAEKALSH